MSVLAVQIRLPVSKLLLSMQAACKKNPCIFFPARFFARCCLQDKHRLLVFFTIVTECVVCVQGRDPLTFSFLSSFLFFDWAGVLWPQLSKVLKLVRWACNPPPPPPHTHTPPYPPLPISPSLISLMVSVDVKHHVYLPQGPLSPVSPQRQVICLLQSLSLRPVFISGGSLHCFLVGVNKS